MKIAISVQIVRRSFTLLLALTLLIAPACKKKRPHEDKSKLTGPGGGPPPAPTTPDLAALTVGYGEVLKLLQGEDDTTYKGDLNYAVLLEEKNKEIRNKLTPFIKYFETGKELNETADLINLFNAKIIDLVLSKAVKDGKIDSSFMPWTSGGSGYLGKEQITVSSFNPSTMSMENLWSRLIFRIGSELDRDNQYLRLFALCTGTKESPPLKMKPYGDREKLPQELKDQEIFFFEHAFVVSDKKNAQNKYEIADLIIESLGEFEQAGSGEIATYIAGHLPDEKKSLKDAIANLKNDSFVKEANPNFKLNIVQTAASTETAPTTEAPKLTQEQVDLAFYGLSQIR